MSTTSVSSPRVGGLLGGFRLRAGLDFITIGGDRQLLVRNDAEMKEGLKRGFDGLAYLPKEGPTSVLDAWLTVHQPTRSDLQKIIDLFPLAAVQKLEVHVDFLPKERSTAEESCLALYKALRGTLSPQTHERMTRLYRKQFFAGCGYRRIQTVRVPVASTTFKWYAEGLEVRLYIKREDDAGRVQLQMPVVRIEATLLGAGTQFAGVHRAGMLPAFMPELRRFVSPMLSVASGVVEEHGARPARIVDPAVRQQQLRSQDRRERALRRGWERSGAHYARANDLRIRPDSIANRRIERAIKQMVERIGQLSPPEKVADYDEWVSDQLGMYDLFPHGRQRSYRATASRRLPDGRIGGVEESQG